ncbi:VOC family protein [Williamsia sterculiae]|nr:hypothetical protein [Williamsia sterculiae]
MSSRGDGLTVHNDDVIDLGDFPPMFYFDDPDGNGLVFIEDRQA